MGGQGRGVMNFTKNPNRKKKIFLEGGGGGGGGREWGGGANQVNPNLKKKLGVGGGWVRLGGICVSSKQKEI